MFIVQKAFANSQLDLKIQLSYSLNNNNTKRKLKMQAQTEWVLCILYIINICLYGLVLCVTLKL